MRQNAAEPADLVVLNAKILTVDERFREAQALAVRDGRFVAVGSTERGARSHRRRDTRDRRTAAAPSSRADRFARARPGVACGQRRRSRSRTCDRLASCRTGFEPRHGRVPRDTWIMDARVSIRRACASGAFPTRQELDEGSARIIRSRSMARALLAQHHWRCGLQA